MIRVMSIFGTRPEAIKMAPVVHALQKHPDCESLVCVTGQHRDMLDQVMALFEIEADEDLDLMLPKQNLLDLTARALQGLRHGPRNTSDAGPYMVIQRHLCGTLESYGQIPVGHRSRTRTGDRTAPFPEEGNRILTDAISTFILLQHSGLLRISKKKIFYQAHLCHRKYGHDAPCG